MTPTPTHFLTEQLQQEHSQRQAQGLAAWIGRDPERLAALLDIFMGNNQRLCQRAAWVLGKLSDRAPDMLELALPQLIGKMCQPGVHDAVKRNVLRLLQDREIPDYLLDELTDAGFRFLADPKEAVAVRVFAMSVLENICNKVPELKPELRLLLEEHLPHGTAGFKSRGRKILKRLQAQ